MADTSKRPATYEDLLQVPENLVAEIVDGELFTSPRPASPHARAATSVGARIFRAFDDGDDGPGGWWILNEPELHLAADILVPDIAGCRRERLPILPDTTAFELAPDWLCEVISPSTGRLDRLRKLPAYARHGVAHAWLVDPILQMIEVFRLVHGSWSLIAVHGGDETVRLEPFEEIEINLGRLWLGPSAPA